MASKNYCSVAFCRGASGRSYAFEAHEIGQPLPPVASVYVIARVDPSGGITPVHVARTVDLVVAFQLHDALPWIHAQRPTHILVHRECDAAVRSEIEADICAAWAPVANAA